MAQAMPPSERRVLGRYVLHAEIASGGMATVHLGRLVGAVGFARTVAIKRLHPQFAKDAEFVSMFVDEARLASRIVHPNVVPTLDVVATGDQLFLVMEYVRGESLARLTRQAHSRKELPIPPWIAVSIACGALQGLHAAHEAKDENGELLQIVHRDVSPQNIIVGIDGVARVLDFGVARAAGRIATTQDGQLKGKLAYMSPEQMRQTELDRRTDIHAMAVVLWESLVGRRLFTADTPTQIMARVLDHEVPPPSREVPGLPAALDDVVMRGLDRDPRNRFATAREMAFALERALPSASAVEVGDWVERIGAESLSRRASVVSKIEKLPASGEPSTSDPISDRTPISTSGPASTAEPIEADGKSQATIVSLTMSEKMSIARPQRRARRLAIPLLILVALAGTAVLTLRAKTSESTSVMPAVANPAEPLPSVTASSVPVTAPSPAPAAEPRPTEEKPAVSGEAAAPAPPLRVTKSRARPATPARDTTPSGRAAEAPSSAPTPAKPATPKDCTTMDSAGILHVKPDCL